MCSCFWRAQVSSFKQRFVQYLAGKGFEQYLAEKGFLLSIMMYRDIGTMAPHRLCGKLVLATVEGMHASTLEGILFLYNLGLRKLFDIKLFVDVDDDERLCRRLERDVQQRGRDVDGVLAQYQRFVKPAFDAYISGTKEHADLIIPQGAKNEIGLGVIVDVVAENFSSYVR